ncbi:MAG: hypothetical protein OXE94_02585 [Aestuariivita sp.]|nr:hypothetical protein [Aestuariivita sp.]MCY4203699.1 hypothetical protein [Aestuariivita sp.]MCY4287031.1 hypothetical protein [Aestuariivita sp.]
MDSGLNHVGRSINGLRKGEEPNISLTLGGQRYSQVYTGRDCPIKVPKFEDAKVFLGTDSKSIYGIRSSGRGGMVDATDLMLLGACIGN